MHESQHLAHSLTALFTDGANGWFTPFSIAVSGMSAAQAAEIPSPGFNSVWGLVKHITFWQEYFLDGLLGNERESGEESWAPGPPDDEAGWQTAVARALETNLRLAEVVLGLTDQDLLAPFNHEGTPRWQVIQGTINHNSYHICEIISVRHMLGLWLEHDYL